MDFFLVVFIVLQSFVQLGFLFIYLCVLAPSGRREGLGDVHLTRQSPAVVAQRALGVEAMWVPDGGFWVVSHCQSDCGGLPVPSGDGTVSLLCPSG